MWKNLRDVRSMAEKITSVIAPLHKDDEEEYSEEEEGEEYYEEGEEEYSESEEAVGEPSNPRSPFGLVGMLARAVDSEQRNYDNEESHSNENEMSRDEHVDLLSEEEEVDFQQPSNARDDSSPVGESSPRQSASARLSTVQEQHRTSSPRDGILLSGEDSQPQQNSLMISASFSTKLEQTRGPASSRRILDRDDSITTRSSDMTPHTVDHESEHEPEPARFSLVRESGSLSPQRKPKASVGSDGIMEQNSTPPLSTRSLGSTPCGAEVALSPLKDILYAHQQQASASVASGTLELTSVQPGSRLPRDALLGSFSVANTEHEKELLEQADDNAISHALHIPFATEKETEPGNGIANNDQERGTKRVDSGVVPKSNSAAEGASRAFSLPSITLDAMVEDDEEDEEEDAHPVASATTDPTNQEPVVAPVEHDTSIHNNRNGGSKLSTAPSDEQTKRIEKLEKRCKELKKQLVYAESHIIELQQQTSSIVEKDDSEQEKLMQHFQEKEARLLQAAAEEHDQDMKALRYEMDERIMAMQRQLVDERNAFQQDRAHMDALLTEANARAEKIERQARDERGNSDKSASQVQQQQARALRMAEDKLAHSMALLDERDENVKQLKDMIKALESKMTEHKEGVQEAEEEMDELHTENEALHNHVERLQEECSELRKKVTKMEADSDKLVHLKMELRMLKEDHSRQKAKVQTVAASAESSTAQLEAERDEALARVHDLQLQLSAAMADIDVAKSDAERVMTANGNLQAALEAFQNEREAEMAMIEENRREQEEAMAAAHAAALDATHEANLAEIRQIQRASDSAVMTAMDEIKRLEEKLEMFRVENVQMRRSLDEAIKRLQATQDDVVDRSFMKNILLDWLTKTEKKDKGRVLELMASVLHFTDAEKEKVHIDDGSTLRKLVAPPPSKTDLEHLEGDNVREKWVNFLIAEAED